MVGGLGAFLITGLTGCDNKSANNQQQGQGDAFNSATQKQNAFVIIEKTANGQYQIAEEFPANKTTIVLRSPDGSERILSQEEIDKLVKEEAARIDNGTSGLTNPQMSEGMGLGGVLLSSIAGAMLGSWIGNKLFGNQNYQNQRKAQYKSPQTYSRSQSSFKKAATSSTSSSKKSGFFGSKSGSSKSGSFSGSGSRSFGG
eukprot:TRINITY_DN514836_c0_g1_i1.p1 TRINITY_DN514836_c0_g1~~TRINITY_DN514836_c0_g1_i1.p1  ORF type:complete len:200 (-),score=60.10 TRINITY_DN514836_c0_g1_i1:496-1095(-)